MILALVESFGLTPLAAQREAMENPLIWRLLHVRLYEQAHRAWLAWESMSEEQRKGRTAPSGPLVDQVRRDIRAVREEMAAEHQAAFEAAGRV